MSKLPKGFDYDSIPVYYCKQCLSLKIKGVPSIPGMDYCDECNSTNIEQTTIEEWEKLYQQRYGYKFLNKPVY
jgi:hypothetical protein